MEQMLLHAFLHLEHLKLGVKRIALGTSNEMHLHNHKFSELAIILRARNTIHWADGRCATLERGDVLLIHPGCVHGYEHTDGLELLNLLYEADRLPLLQLDAGSLPRFRFLVSSRQPDAPPPERPFVRLPEAELESVNKMFSHLEEELQADQPGKHLYAFSLFVGTLALIGRAGGTAAPPDPAGSADAALNYLNLHYHEKISTARLARIACLSERSLFRRFRELTGYSPLEYRRRKQLERAEELLRSSALPLARIAGECGFCDSNHLVKLFSARYGLPPGAFRRKERTTPAKNG